MCALGESEEWNATSSISHKISSQHPIIIFLLFLLLPRVARHSMKVQVPSHDGVAYFLFHES